MCLEPSEKPVLLKALTSLGLGEEDSPKLCSSKLICYSQEIVTSVSFLSLTPLLLSLPSLGSRLRKTLPGAGTKLISWSSLILGAPLFFLSSSPTTFCSEVICFCELTRLYFLSVFPLGFCRLAMSTVTVAAPLPGLAQCVPCQGHLEADAQESLQCPLVLQVVWQLCVQ